MGDNKMSKDIINEELRNHLEKFRRYFMSKGAEEAFWEIIEND